MNKAHNKSIDYVRIAACMLVVLMHSPVPGDNAIGPFLTALSYFTAPCIGLFFMVSGALLLPVKQNYTQFLCHRFGKIVSPTLVWTAVYLAFHIYNTHDITEAEIITSVASIPFSAQGHGVLWFMYTLAGIYLSAPIISAWIEKARKTDLQIVLGLWGITLCYPLLENWIGINESTTGILYYFGGYAGYFLLGYYLKKYPESLSLPVAVVVALTGVITLYFCKTNNLQVDFYRVFWYLSVFIVSLCIAYWKLIHYISTKYNIGGVSCLIFPTYRSESISAIS